MVPGQSHPPAPDPITIDLTLNQLIQRVDTNITQHIIVTTADKAQLCLMRALDRMERRKAWMAPAGILVTLAVVFPTTTFQDFLGLSKDYWKAFFSIAAIATITWLMITLARIRGSVTVEQVVEQLRTDSLAARAQEAPRRRPDDLVILSALYGSRDNRVDVSGQLNRAIRDNKLHAYVGNQLGGDPCPGTPKDLIVKYRFNNQDRQETLAEGTDLNLP